MLQRFNMSDTQYVRDLADAGIITDAQKLAYLERLRLQQEKVKQMNQNLANNMNKQPPTNTNNSTAEPNKNSQAI